MSLIRMDSLHGRGKEWAKAGKCPICLETNPCGCGQPRVNLKANQVEAAVAGWLKMISSNFPRSFKLPNECRPNLVRRLVETLVEMSKQ